MKESYSKDIGGSILFKILFDGPQFRFRNFNLQAIRKISIRELTFVGLERITTGQWDVGEWVRGLARSSRWNHPGIGIKKKKKEKKKEEEEILVTRTLFIPKRYTSIGVNRG